MHDSMKIKDLETAMTLLNANYEYLLIRIADLEAHPALRATASPSDQPSSG